MRHAQPNGKQLSRLILGLGLLLIACKAEQFEFLVPKGRTICFEDFATQYASLIYGYTVYPISSLSDNLGGAFTGASTTAGSSSNSGVHRLLQVKSASKKRRRDDLELDDTLGDSEEDLDQYVDRAWKSPKASKKKNGKGKEFDAFASGISEEIAKGVGSKVQEILATFELKADNGTLLSPKNLKAFTLKKLSVETDFERIEACVSNVHASEDLLVGLTWSKHFKSDSPVGIGMSPPTKEQSDSLLNQIMGVETTLEHSLKYYETIQLLEDHFVNSGNAVLGSIFFVGLFMVFGYLIVGVILRLAVEKSLRSKKII